MSDLIACRTIDGGSKLVDRNVLSFRPSVYAIVVHQGKILVHVMTITGKYTFPGGGIELGEAMEGALVREVKEECGIDVEILNHAFFKESFFYYGPTNQAWQCHMFYFLCRARSFDLSDALSEEGESDPQWVDLQTARAEDFQVFGKEVLEYARAL